MKKLILGLCVAAIFVGSLTAQNISKDKGKKIFEAKNCVLCHKKDVDTIGPSLLTISKIYSGKGALLTAFLRGQGTPIVDPARASVMNSQLVKIETLTDEDMQALAIYIISANDRPF